MGTAYRIVKRTLMLCVAVFVLAAEAPDARAAEEALQWRATIYGWFPGIQGDTRFPSGASGPSIDVDSGDVIDALKFGAMGALEVRHKQCGFYTDVYYSDLGATKSGTRDLTVGRLGLPAGVTANLSLDMKSWGWTLAGTYQLDNSKRNTTDLLFGARMFYIKQTLDWAFAGSVGSIGLPGASGRSEVDDTLWDAVIGLKGVATLSGDRRWVLPYYVDVGTGQSDLTWQALVGVGYSFDWGTALVAWRYMDYELKSDAAIDNMNFSGPLLGVSFRW